MFRKKGITLRIATGYLVVILFTGLMIGSSFWLLLSRHLEEMARESLFRDVRTLAGVIEATPEGTPGARGHMMRNYLGLNLLGRVIQGDYLLVNGQGVVLESSTAGLAVGSMLDPGVLNKLAASDIYEGHVTLGDVHYLAAARHLGGGAGRGGAVVLLTRVEGLKQVRRELLIIFLVSFGAATLVALGLTIWLAGRISRPLTLLKEKADRVAERNFGWDVDLQTGDEIGELGRAINAMDKKLADYDRVQRQFFQNASHELKSPLMSIQGYAEGIKDGVFQGGDADRALDVITREAGRLKGLVEELVYLGQLQSSSGVYKFEETELLEILEQAVESQRVLALERGVELSLAPVPDIMLYADGEKMVRVFINLIANAIRHAVSLVQVAAAPDVEGTVRVTVRDDGAGFSEQDLEHLWDRFYKGSRGGSGLGLSIVRAIVHEHGGTVKARNTEPGAEIKVTLPN